MSEDSSAEKTTKTPEPPPTHSQKRVSFPIKKGWLMMVLLFILVPIAAFAGSYYASYQMQSNPSPTPNIPAPTLPTNLVYPTSSYTPPTKVPTNTVSINPGAIEWLSYPQVTNINLVDLENIAEDLQGEVTYHYVGTFEDGSHLINAYVPFAGMGTYYNLYRVVQSPDNTLYVILNPTNDQYSSYTIDDLRSVIQPSILFTDYSIPSLQSPETITLDQGVFDKGIQQTQISMAQLKNPHLLGQVDQKSLYAVYNKDGNNNGADSFFSNAWKPEYGDIQTRFIYLQLPDNTLISYNLDFDFVSDDYIPHITWSDGTTNATYFNTGIRGTGGCGGSIGSVIQEPSDLLSNLQPAGMINQTRYSNKTIYRITDINNLAMNFMYESYKVGRDDTISLDEFATKPTHFLWQDNMGDWHIFTSGDYSSLAECAKPVIYLYPQTKQDVSVSVGADITKSDPLYPSNGWLVTASPDGILSYQGKEYDSLFWEGIGHGQYPNYKDQGVVVPQGEVVSTIQSQLETLGLNQKETHDFLTFWTDKLPQTPYVRLTWLTTEDMNSLAPLTVHPRPDTAIRVFLESEGLYQPKQLTPQKLTAIQRHGFTLVEWGGLLIHNK